MMKKLILFAVLIISFASCDKRNCQCGDDLILIDDDNIAGVDFDLQVPNAVLNEGLPLAFRLISAQEVKWTDQFIKLYNKDQVFIETTDLSSFLTFNNALSFPHENFELDNGDPFSGPLEVEFEITTKNNKSVKLEGSIYFYNCHDIQDDFGAEDCIWPGQVLGIEYYQEPC